MARAKKSSAGNTNEWKMVNVVLSPSQRAAIIDRYPDALNQLSAALLVGVEAGLKISFAYNDYDSRYSLAVTDKVVARPTHGHVFMFGHKELERLASILLFVIYDYAQNDRLGDLIISKDDDW